MEKNIEYNADCIVVGAGPAGISAAYTIAKEGKKVVLIERAQYPGSKNMYGGAVYTKALKQVFEEDFSKITYERIINNHSWSFLFEEGSFELNYKKSSLQDAYAIKRFDFERELVEIAKSAGVYYIPSTLVKSLVKENNRVVGIKTELEEYYAPITILADGVNSLLSRSIGLRKEYNSKDILLSIKETLKLDKKIIEERFNLKTDNSNGANKQYFGYSNKFKDKSLFMMSFLYTFKDSIMLGVGVNLEDLKREKLNINEILDDIKKHPDIEPLIKEGKTIEYSAHLIPEGGYKKIPKLVDNGVMVVGDAAGFVNGVHFEGTNFALISGLFAAQSAILALEKNDFSKKQLSVYVRKLKNSFILRDLYSYRNMMKNLSSRTKSIERYYPQKIDEFFEIITGANCVSKSSQIRQFIFNFVKTRNLKELIKDIFCFLKCALDLLFGC